MYIGRNRFSDAFVGFRGVASPGTCVGFGAITMVGFEAGILLAFLACSSASGSKGSDGSWGFLGLRLWLVYSLALVDLQLDSAWLV